MNRWLEMIKIPTAKTETQNRAVERKQEVTGIFAGDFHIIIVKFPHPQLTHPPVPSYNNYNAGLLIYKIQEKNAMIFETHAHYDDEAFDSDREELLSSMQENGIGHIVNVSASLDSLDRTRELMEQYPFVYGAMGLHPDEVGDMNEAVMQKLRDYCRLEKTVAVGEIGLDYYWEKENHETQRYWFERQLELAREEKLPVIIHSRDAAADTLQVMKDCRAGEIGGVVHCFSYSREMAGEYLKMGLYLGIGGVLTFKNARKLREVVEYAPLDQLLLETDSPYLAPVPYRGKRNSSLNIPLIVQQIAEIKHLSCEEVIEQTEQNAMHLFLANQ